MESCIVKFFERYPQYARFTNLTTNATVSVSSTVQECPVAHLLDGNPHTFWQSDYINPHTIDINLGVWSSVRYLCYLPVSHDLSYAPSVVHVRLGPAPDHWTSITSKEDCSQSDWEIIELPSNISKDVQLFVSYNYGQGKNCRVAQILLLGDPVMDENDILC